MFFVDRSKNIVRRSGENIAAVEVEGALLALPAVKNCAVAPVPDEIRGEEVMALIVPADGTAPDADNAQALFDASRDALAYFKLPGYIAFADALPLTSSAKLQRGELKKLCAALVETGRVYDLRDQKRREPVGGVLAPRQQSRS
jgi:acyl-coenzyme A synthetase/AMP-(fatty) acid ligase